MLNKRDYNQESQDNQERKYFYNFDNDVMHPFILRSFLSYRKSTGRTLELGSFQGHFSGLLYPYTESLTCVEASDEAIAIAKQNLKDKNITYHDSLFEDVNLTGKFDTIIMSHVLEHLEDPVSTLKRVNDEWLEDDGYFFLVCPNANAPSRQIAVKMGLIDHNAAVTPGEKAHGHFRTYSLDTLEADARKAGLNVISRNGVFFKALANFQFDKLSQTDIISPEYLEGCYQLGHQYPDLCASIFLVCEKGSK